jgi:hypothetical protein
LVVGTKQIGQSGVELVVGQGLKSRGHIGIGIDLAVRASVDVDGVGIGHPIFGERACLVHAQHVDGTEVAYRLWPLQNHPAFGEVGRATQKGRRDDHR